MENTGSLPFLLVTANVGSVFEDPSRLLNIWIQEFLSNVASRRPAFIALHLQEVGGKTYEKSMEYVQEFIKNLCESAELADYNRIRVYLDEDYNSAEHFTALGNLYFAIRTIDNLQMWNFLTHEWETVEGKNIHTGNIESVASKEKAKFPQQFFPECKWSRKGFMRTRWSLNGSVFDLVNIHLFHDASNLAACEEYPSVYCKSRRRALIHTLERFHQDSVNQAVPYFVFGDFNFRCDTEGVVKKLTEDLTMHRIPHPKSDNSKVQYRDSDGANVLTLGKKEFTHYDQSTFKESWLRQFDRELDSLRSILHEYPITFPPSYPYEEDPGQPGSYMSTRCPAWCDRILISPAARKLIDDERENGKTGNATTATMAAAKGTYGIMGEVVCMGDHKPVFLNVRIKTSQGTHREITADELRARLQEYDDLNARISDEPARGGGELILQTHYVQITPRQSQDSLSGSGSTLDEIRRMDGGGDYDGTTIGGDDPGVEVDDVDTVFYQQSQAGSVAATGATVGGASCSSMIFRETTV
nr:type I inositol 1,4,5-trisphosphate 5-phosphatase isoform X2 [Aedes albopictus]